MTKKQIIDSFDPNGVGLNNGNFIGLPFDESTADIVFISAPWDVTVSFAEGTSTGAANILEASTQLDLMDPYVKNAWQRGIYMLPINEDILQKNNTLRKLSSTYISFLENGGLLHKNEEMQNIQNEINKGCEEFQQYIYETTKSYLQKGKMVGLVGGDHSSPLGYLIALAEQYEDFGILQIDAHMDLRKAYEGFTFSHASIFYNALQIKNISKLTQVGIRDWCEEEESFVKKLNNRIEVFYDHEIQERKFLGDTFSNICEHIVRTLPQNVYISFDIDGLDPKLCPNTGTPVPSGLEFQEAIFLIKKIKDSGRKIIGFDLCEVAGKGNDWDGNVGARILYRMANLAASCK